MTNKFLNNHPRLTGTPVSLFGLQGQSMSNPQVLSSSNVIPASQTRGRIAGIAWGLTAPALLVAVVLWFAPGLVAQAAWTPVGPAGGDARAFAAVPGDPSHIYLGTTNSWIYESTDRGASWHRLSKLDEADGLVLDHILVDPNDARTIYVAAWTFDHPDGGLWISHNAGRTWKANEGMRGQSIRTLTMAPSNSKTMFAGTLTGVYRSTDSGATWKQISPVGSAEIHEVESLAVDPGDPNTLYAGTWHLPWKTTDGGANWHNIKQGLIEDSDVFSIILDPAQPAITYLSACSGIYKSENAGELFKKIQGIPSTARRTRVLKQDPVNHDLLYAGTTEGLYKTVDAGKTFQRMTGPDVIVNDVFVDPKDTSHVLLATDRRGVLASNDAGVTFTASNEGYSARKVEALVVDRANPSRLFAGVVNDKEYGGVFVSNDGGGAWKQLGGGLDGNLEGRDVFALAQAPDGALLAGTNGGIFAYNPAAADGADDQWEPRNVIQNTVVKQSTVVRKGKKVSVEKQVKLAPKELGGRVYALDLSGDAWLASTGMGLLTSRDKGASWQGAPVMGSGEYITAAAHGAVMAAARRDGLALSIDAGITWMPVQIPPDITRIYRLAFSADGTLWLGTREGVYLTRDQGKTWNWIERLPFREINDLYFDANLGKILVSSRSSDFVYAIDPIALNWKWWKTGGYKLFLIRGAGSRLIAASLSDGVLIEPRSAVAAAGQK
jgi:photosystem II stability/assembly factor-like uncharacterized protein